MPPAHIVVLLPGFLGFDHLRGHTYFADRFVAGLRAGLEAKVARPIPVIPLSTLPLGSLADRQHTLLRALEQLRDKLCPDPAALRPTWHLVGHSTGGLDAALLARTHRLETRDGHSVFALGDCGKLNLPICLRSVTTLATPHYGTCMTRAPLPMMTHSGRISLQALRDLAKLLFDLTQRDATLARIQFALAAALQGGQDHFFSRLLFGNELANDLDPQVASALTRTENRNAAVKLFSLCSIAPDPRTVDESRSNRLFRDLWEWTAHDANNPTLPRPPPFPQVAGNASLVIGSPPELIPAITPESNDGVVNTERQLDGTFSGLVVGDHADVIGRYYRADLLDGKTIDPGLLVSSAKFDDHRFFAVLARITDCITRTF